MYKDQRKRTEYFRKRRKERINFLRKYKQDKCCAICGWNEHPEILQFHHIDPSTKSFDFGGSEVGNLSFDKIKAEMDKCILLCPNCHQWHHYQESKI